MSIVIDIAEGKKIVPHIVLVLKVLEETED
jgi:hypothetical protein